jgi:hypothetical protein
MPPVGSAGGLATGATVLGATEEGAAGVPLADGVAVPVVMSSPGSPHAARATAQSAPRQGRETLLWGSEAR